MALYHSMQELIGHTPLVELQHFGLPDGVKLFAKLELYNPSGSVKDRTGLYMIRDAERSGILKPGATIVLGTAGNTGLGIAFAALNRGYKLLFVVPTKFSAEKQSLLRALGAQVITGVGFLGAGTILLTGRNHIRGLTTAAGLWASACLGLAIGAGFYEGALGGAVAIFISLALLPRMENYAYRHSDILNLYVEVASLGAYRDVMKAFRVSEISVYESTLERGDVLTPNGVAFVISLKVPRRMKTIDVLEMIEGFNGVTLVEEL